LSASRRIVTICSSVNRLFFMTSFLRWKPFSQVSTGPKITGQVTSIAVVIGRELIEAMKDSCQQLPSC
ncbi:hypothetical protein, partial [Burkholderia gladioli]|uniref:hypothetical protein n=1 Tax=Burkholderia gladioli TaxID=28095 RepID=UPI001C21FD0E